MRLTFEAGSCHFCSFWLHWDKIKLWQVTHKMSWPARAEQTLWNVRVDDGIFDLYWTLWWVFQCCLSWAKDTTPLKDTLRVPYWEMGCRGRRRDRRSTVGVTEGGAVVGTGHSSGPCRHRADMESRAGTGKGLGKNTGNKLGTAWLSTAEQTTPEKNTYNTSWDGGKNGFREKMGTWA